MADLFSGALVAGGPFLCVGGDLVQHAADGLGVGFGEGILQIAETGGFGFWSGGGSGNGDLASDQRGGGGGGLRGSISGAGTIAIGGLPIGFFLAAAAVWLVWFLLAWVGLYRKIGLGKHRHGYSAVNRHLDPHSSCGN